MFMWAMHCIAASRASTFGLYIIDLSMYFPFHQCKNVMNVFHIQWKWVFVRIPNACCEGNKRNEYDGKKGDGKIYGDWLM